VSLYYYIVTEALFFLWVLFEFLDFKSEIYDGMNIFGHFSGTWPKPKRSSCFKFNLTSF
jgi:hypothetical protein